MTSVDVVHPTKDLSGCVMPPEMLTETIQTFPPKYHRLFQNVLKDMFGCDDLAYLHQCDHGPVETMVPALYKARIQAKLDKGTRGIAEDRATGKKITKAQKMAWHSNIHFKRFVEIYKSFIYEFVFPQFQQYGDLIFQAEPIIRIVLPGSVATSKLHADGDFWHQMNEINYWVPMVAVSGANSLWCESTPGQGDYHPFEVDGSAGQFMRFYGNQCRHYTTENTTETTRISFDFRVIPACYFADTNSVVKMSTAVFTSPVSSRLGDEDRDREGALESKGELSVGEETEVSGESEKKVAGGAEEGEGEGLKVWCGAKPRGAKPLEEGKYYLRMTSADRHHICAE